MDPYINIPQTMDGITEESATEIFDQLVSEGVITYGPSESIEYDCGGFPIEFRLSSTLSTKPFAPSSGPPSNIISTSSFSSSSPETNNKNKKIATSSTTTTTPRHTPHHQAPPPPPKWRGPSSDLYLPTPRLILCTLPSFSPNTLPPTQPTQPTQPTHDLALNIFSLDRPQFMLPTVDPSSRQHTPLTLSDFTAALQFLSPSRFGKEGKWSVVYNCGEEAGCSRVHKHLQGVRGSGLRAWESVVGHGGGGGGGGEAVPFRCFVKRFGEGEEKGEERGFEKVGAEGVLGVYEKWVREMDGLGGAGSSGEGGRCCPHNVIMWKDCLVVVPRRKAAVGLASANAVGMMGGFWVAEQRFVDEWLRLGVREVLAELGFPRECEK